MTVPIGQGLHKTLCRKCRRWTANLRLICGECLTGTPMRGLKKLSTLRQVFSLKAIYPEYRFIGGGSSCVPRSLAAAGCPWAAQWVSEHELRIAKYGRDIEAGRKIQFEEPKS